MSARLATLMLAGFATAFSYIAFLMGLALRPLYVRSFHIKSGADLDIIMPAISRAAADHAWIFVLLLVLVCIAGVFLFRRFPRHIPRLMVADLCVQALVLWMAMFCYFYDGFLGPVSLHHPQWFDLDNFMTLCFGVFPVTLAAVLLPLFTSLFLWHAEEKIPE